jgi:hypothetical protein
MKIGDHVYILSGLDVEEWEVYEIDAKGEPWVKRDGRCGMAARHYLNETYLDVDGAVYAAKSKREREIKRLASRLTKLAINPSITVRLLKIKRPPK